MNFADAVKSVLSQYAGFSGRARRSEYWFFFLFSFVLGIVVSIIDSAVGAGGILSILVWLALLLPSLAVGVRRLHDTSRSGWWLLIAFVPLIGAIVLIVFFATDSHGDNQFGPSPKGAGAAL